MIDPQSCRRWLKMSTPLGADNFLLVELHAREAVSELFQVELRFVTPLRPALRFETLLGQAVVAQCGLADGSTRLYHGIVRELAEVGRDAEYRSFAAVLVPEWWRWSRNRRCRVFQEATVPEILEQALGHVPTRFRLAADYPPRNYCVQYDESDFHFATRLMEEEGIFYFFTHAADGHLLVIADRSSDCPEVATPSAVVYDPRPAPRTTTSASPPGSNGSG